MDSRLLGCDVKQAGERKEEKIREQEGTGLKEHAKSHQAEKEP